MMRMFMFAAAAFLAVGSSARSQPNRAPAPDYSKDSTWLCLPGRGASCSSPLATTPLTPSGYGLPVLSTIAKDPPLDCFYVYPTVSRDQGLNSDLSPSEELGATQVQFARFASVCRTFAPLYRQMTIG